MCRKSDNILKGYENSEQSFSMLRVESFFMVNFRWYWINKYSLLRKSFDNGWVIIGSWF